MVEGRKTCTTKLGLQFYGGNLFDGGVTGKTGKSYSCRTAFALEKQHFSDSPNHPQFPSTTLNAGGEYLHTCIYKFGIK